MDKLNVKILPTTTGTLYFSRCPYGKDDLEVIKELKIDCIYNLAKEWETMIEIEKTVCNTVIAGGIVDYSIPDDINVFYAQIQYITELLKQNKRVLVHCYFGHGRTSMALCCIVLALKQLSLEETFKKVWELAHGPETEKQKEFVRKFNMFFS